MTQPIKNNNFTEILTGRRSIRSFDPNVKISKDELTDILALASTAPSAANVQPWRLAVIESAEGKKQLSEMLDGNQLQNDTSSAMILVMADLEAHKLAPEIYNKAVDSGWMPEEVRDIQVNRIVNGYAQIPMPFLREIFKIDASLFSMQLMLAARAYGYETNPMAGFNQGAIVKHFKLDDTKLMPVMLIAIGKANESGYQSVRLSPEEFTQWF